MTDCHSSLKPLAKKNVSSKKKKKFRKGYCIFMLKLSPKYKSNLEVYEPSKMTFSLIFSGCKPYAELEKVVKGRMLVKDVMKLSPSEQTSSLESFHNIVCLFASKSVHYFYNQMEARYIQLFN